MKRTPKKLFLKIFWRIVDVFDVAEIWNASARMKNYHWFFAKNHHLITPMGIARRCTMGLASSNACQFHSHLLRSAYKKMRLWRCAQKTIDVGIKGKNKERWRWERRGNEFEEKKNEFHVGLEKTNEKKNIRFRWMTKNKIWLGWRWYLGFF